MKALIGPIIGKVDDTSARILIEYDTTGDVNITLISNGSYVKSITQKVEERKATIFIFTGLTPNTKYDVQITPFSGKLSSSFKTMKDSSCVKDLKICWISCNDASKNAGLKDLNLWYCLAEEIIKENYDMVCHIGDQVYLDSDAWHGNRNNVYNKLQDEIFNKYPKSEWPNHQKKIKETIKEEYRRSWNFPPTSFVLANISNIMLFDDHDVRDDWGDRKEDWDPNSDKCDYYYGQICRSVYYEYQRQLWDSNIDLNNIKNVKEEYFTLRFSDVGLFFMELRGDKTWHRTKDYDDSQILSQKQWDRLDYALNTEFKDVQNFVLVSQSTVVFLNHTINQIAGMNANDCKEQWVMHEDEQYKLLKKLYDWKYQPGFKKREVTIVCGDVHFGGHSDIYFNNRKAFKQFTSSSVTNGIKEKHRRLMTKIGQNLSENLKGGFSFDHHDWTGKNNYGCTHFKNQVTQNGRFLNIVDCWNVYARDSNEKNEGKFSYGKKIDNNNYFKTPDNSQTQCCTIF